MTSPLPTNSPSIVWNRFLVAFARLFAFPVRNPAWEDFIPWRDRLLLELASQEATDAYAGELQRLLDDDDTATAAQLMIMELEGFTTYVERVTGPIAPDAAYPELQQTQTQTPDTFEEGKVRFGVAGIIVDSLRDLLDQLPFKWKALLKGFSELANIVTRHA